ncbi:MAG: hypothetical protein ACJASM_002931 [Salibacteraceae bacterium]
MFDAVVLNEASLPFRTVNECEKKISIFFQILHKAKAENISLTRVDNVEGNWAQLNYADGFIFGQWLNNISDIDRRRQIKSVLSSVKCPFVDINNNRALVNVDNVLFVLESEEDLEVLGLGFASLNNSHGLSFASNDCWGNESISIVKLWCENGQEFREKLTVSNIATIEQLDLFTAYYEAQRQRNRAYLDGLNITGNNEFDNLTFTKSVLRSLRSSSLQSLDFKRVINVLNKLNTSIVSSSNLVELVRESGLSISSESESTMLNRSLVRLRTFQHPVLGPSVFEIHVKNFNGGRRMHILIDYEAKNICIGYFGKHLKTASA